VKGLWENWKANTTQSEFEQSFSLGVLVAHSRYDLQLISFNNDFIQTLNTIGAQKLSLLTSKRPLYFYDYLAVASKLAVLYTDLAHRLAVQQSQKKISDEALRNNFNSLV
jgi:hypothetical protein